MKRFKKNKDKPTISRAEALQCTPVKNIDVRETRLDGGETLLTYTVTVRPWFVGLVKRLGGASDGTHLKKLQLDPLGTDVWDLVDGRRSVRSIVAQFAQIHRLHPKEAEVSVTVFLRELGKRGLVGLK
jgi:hypothetical protein